MSTLRTIALSIILLAAGPLVKAQTADEVIAKYIDALGGKEKLLSIKTLYTEGTAVMQNGMEINSKSWRVKDKLYRQETSFGMGSVVIIATPTKGWVSNPRNGGAFTAMPDQQLKNMQTQLDPSGPLVDYAVKGSKVEILGKDTVGAKNCYKLKLTLASGAYITYFIDVETYHILRETRKRDAFSGGRGGNPEGEFSIDFSDYQKTADGYVFPYTVVIGGFGARTNVEKIEVNKPVDEEKLSKPENN